MKNANSFVVPLLSMPFVILLLLSLVTTDTIIVHAYPTGAGGCSGGTAAVGGSHLEASKIETDSLDNLGIEVQFDAEALQAADPSTSMSLDVPYEIAVVSSSGDAIIKGCLIRFEPTDGSTTATSDMVTLTPGTDTQLANVCAEPAIGITHTSNTAKSSCTGTVTFLAGTKFNLDVTVVFENIDTSSKYGYSSYSLDIPTTEAATLPSTNDDLETAPPTDPDTTPDTINDIETPPPTDEVTTPDTINDTETPPPTDKDTTMEYGDPMDTMAPATALSDGSPSQSPGGETTGTDSPGMGASEPTAPTPSGPTAPTNGGSVPSSGNMKSLTNTFITICITTSFMLTLVSGASHQN